MSLRPPLRAGLSVLALSIVAACATRAPHSTPPSAQPAPAPPPPAAAQATAAPPQEPPPASQTPASQAPEVGAQSVAPPEPTPPPPNKPDEQPPSACKQLPPCQPVHKVHHRRKIRPKEPQGPEPPVPAQPPAAVDARVGEVGASLTSILGKNVEGPNGENLGRVVDLLADAEGHVRVAIIDFGGFLGVGTRRIAVDWPLLRFNPKTRDKPLTLSVTREKLQSAPEYKDSMSPRVLMPPPEALQNAADTGEAKK
jgi:hypothetical protein